MLTLGESPHALLVAHITGDQQTTLGWRHAGDAAAVEHIEAVSVRDARIHSLGIHDVHMARLAAPMPDLRTNGIECLTTTFWMDDQ